LKLVAPLADVRLDQLVQRDAQRQSRRTLTAAAAIAVAVVAAGLGGFLLLEARERADREQARG
jgi:hypothetical protein